MQIVLLSWVALAADPAAAERLGEVQLVLVDAAGAPWAGLPDAAIRLSREGEAPVALIRTDAGFVARDLAPGAWAFEATAAGLPPARGAIEVPEGGVLRANVVLDADAGGIEELVVVA